MSSLLCGKLSFLQLLPEREVDDIGFTLTGFALEQRLGLQLGHAVVQRIIMKIFGCDRAYEGADLLLLITNSPIRDVSDSIVDKYSPEYPEAEPDGSLAERLERVQRFLIRTMSLPEIARMTVVITDGFHQHYEEEIIQAEQFVARALPHYEDALEVPSLRLVIERGVPVETAA